MYGDGQLLHAAAAAAGQAALGSRARQLGCLAPELIIQCFVATAARRLRVSPHVHRRSLVLRGAASRPLARVGLTNVGDGELWKAGKEAYDAHGFRPLRLAAFHGQMEVVKVLVQLGATGSLAALSLLRARRHAPSDVQLWWPRGAASSWRRPSFRGYDVTQ
jgi:hypothetical protein